MKKICIATYEIEKIHKNGGIATAYKHMADALVREGHDVTIFVTSNMNLSREKLKEAVALFKKDNIKLIFPKEMVYNVASVFETYCSYQAYRTFETLKDMDFDIIHFPDSSGDAYFAVHAKKAGLYFQNTTIIVGAHGSSEWVRESNENTNLSIYDFVLDHLERDCIAYADYVVSPSRYYIEWMKEHGFVLPEKTYSILNCPHMDVRAPKAEKINGCDIKELVFFGRQERRKGFDIFCDAILNCALPEGVTITFLGKPTSTCSYETYRDRFEEKKYKVKFIENYNSQQAIEYLLNDGVIAVIPSRSETMCYTVMECLLNGVPFLAANTGAIPELVDEKFHSEVLFDIDWRSLADKIESLFTSGLPYASPSFTTEGIFSAWMDLHRDIENRTAVSAASVASFNVNGDILAVSSGAEKKEYIVDSLAAEGWKQALAETAAEKVLLSFNTEIAPRMFSKICKMSKAEGTAVLLSNFNSNGALLGTSYKQERFELVFADPLFQFSDCLAIPVACIVDKKDLAAFMKKHAAAIHSSYFFMKILICFLKARGVVLHAVPIACGWSNALFINKEYESSEKVLWLNYFRKICPLHPDMVGHGGVKFVETVRHKDLSRQEKLCIKFVKSPKKFCADSNKLPLRLLSKLLPR